MIINDTNAPSRTIRKKEETKKKITAIAMELFLKQGVDRTTMEQIAEEADVAKGTLYNYFPVKEAIIDEYVRDNLMKKYNERWQRLEKLPNTQMRLEEILKELVEEVLTKNEIYEKHIVYMIQKISSLKRDTKVNNGFRLMAAELISLGQENNEIRKDVQLDVLIGLFEFAFINIVQQFYINPDSFNCDDAVRGCVDICINGIKLQ